MSTPAAGSVAPNPTSTPGSANTQGSMPYGPVPNAMISSSSLPANGESASLDALATIKADEAFRGKILGPAAPGDINAPSASMQQVTGQFISPSLYANPQVTVNSSISSPATPAIVSGAGEGVGGAPAASVIAGATAPATVSTGVVSNGVQNVGVTGVSSATATPITIGNTATGALAPAGTATLANTALATNNQVIGTGMANSPAPASNATATPILTTVGPLGQPGVAATAAGGSVLGVTNVTTSNVTATPTTNRGVSVPVGIATNTMLGTVSANQVGSVTSPATLQTVPIATAARTRAVRTTSGTTATAGLRVVTAPNGAIVVTNQSQSAVQRFITSLGSRRNLTMTSSSQAPQR